jgi:hypothetical protein
MNRLDRVEAQEDDALLPDAESHDVGERIGDENIFGSIIVND